MNWPIRLADPIRRDRRPPPLPPSAAALENGSTGLSLYRSTTRRPERAGALTGSDARPPSRAPAGEQREKSHSSSSESDLTASRAGDRAAVQCVILASFVYVCAYECVCAFAPVYACAREPLRLRSGRSALARTRRSVVIRVSRPGAIRRRPPSRLGSARLVSK